MSLTSSSSAENFTGFLQSILVPVFQIVACLISRLATARTANLPLLVVLPIIRRQQPKARESPEVVNYFVPRFCNRDFFPGIAAVVGDIDRALRREGLPYGRARHRRTPQK